MKRPATSIALLTCLALAIVIQASPARNAPQPGVQRPASGQPIANAASALSSLSSAINAVAEAYNSAPSAAQQNIENVSGVAYP